MVNATRKSSKKTHGTAKRETHADPLEDKQKDVTTDLRSQSTTHEGSPSTRANKKRRINKENSPGSIVKPEKQESHAKPNVKIKPQHEDQLNPHHLPKASKGATRGKATKAEPCEDPNLTKDHILEEQSRHAANERESNHDLKTTPRKKNAKSAKGGTDGKEKGDSTIEANKANDKKSKKAESLIDAMPLAQRSQGLRMFVGAHVSCAKGVHNSVGHALHIGGNAFAMFLKSQRKWANPPLQDEHKDQFKAFCQEHRLDAGKYVLPHGSYLVNLAQEEEEKAAQAYDSFVDDLRRCDALGIRLYNFHPGSTGSAPRPAAIKRIANQLNRAIAATSRVMPVLEAMAGSGNVIGSTFEDLRDIISMIENQARIGVCIDTCHIFAAGYDIRNADTLSKTLDSFDKIVGIKYLKALHLNDSKAPLASHRDLHQNIGLGFLGLGAFHGIMNEPRFEDLPMILETPIDHKDEHGKEVEDKSVWAKEIKLLESLIGMDKDSEEFTKLEKDLADRGAEERLKYQDAFDRKQAVVAKKDKSQTKLSFGAKQNPKAKATSRKSPGGESHS